MHLEHARDRSLLHLAHALQRPLARGLGAARVLQAQAHLADELPVPLAQAAAALRTVAVCVASRGRSFLRSPVRPADGPWCGGWAFAGETRHALGANIPRRTRLPSSIVRDGRFVIWNRSRGFDLNALLAGFTEMTVAKSGGVSVTIRKRAALPDSPYLDTRARVRELLSTVMDLSPPPRPVGGMRRITGTRARSDKLAGMNDNYLSPSSPRRRGSSHLDGP
ncbi:MAG: hypothetical protein J0H50_13170 [Xanthomonadales bacterium]|nr:hypothetical protein [Xanthomonadales bacterium]